MHLDTRVCVYLLHIIVRRQALFHDWKILIQHARQSDCISLSGSLPKTNDVSGETISLTTTPARLAITLFYDNVLAPENVRLITLISPRQRSLCVTACLCFLPCPRNREKSLILSDLMGVGKYKRRVQDICLKISGKSDIRAFFFFFFKGVRLEVWKKPSSERFGKIWEGVYLKIRKLRIKLLMRR